MIMCVGKSASDISLETKMIILEAEQEFVLSIVDEDTSEELTSKDKAFWKTLQGTPSSVLQFCYESGDPEVQTSQAMEGVFVNSGDNPFELIKDSIKMFLKRKLSNFQWMAIVLLAIGTTTSQVYSTSMAMILWYYLYSFSTSSRHFSFDCFPTVDLPLTAKAPPESVVKVSVDPRTAS